VERGELVVGRSQRVPGLPDRVDAGHRVIGSLAEQRN
jgi:hypothetical protein